MARASPHWANRVAGPREPLGLIMKIHVPNHSAIWFFAALWMLTCYVHAQPAIEPNGAMTFEVTSPPAELKLDPVYEKYIDANGYPIIGTKQVNDYALREAAYLVNLMLSKRPDIKEAMVQSGSRMSVMACTEFTTELPEWSWLGDPKSDGRQSPGITARDYWDARARGMGGSGTDPYCSCAEENLLGLAGDPYSTECILIHEFAHNIHLRGANRIDPTFDRRVREAYRAAKKNGLWSGKYASVNHHEYFAEGVQSWFNNNRENDFDHNHVDTRAELEDYDPGLASLCREVFLDTELEYTKPATRLTGHMLGYDPSAAPRFEWPARLREAHGKIAEQAAARSKSKPP